MNTKMYILTITKLITAIFDLTPCRSRCRSRNWVGKYKPPEKQKNMAGKSRCSQGGERDRSLATSFHRAQQKHASRNRPPSSVKTNFSPAEVQAGISGNLTLGYPARRSPASGSMPRTWTPPKG